MGFNRATEPPGWAVERLRQIGPARGFSFVEDRVDVRGDTVSRQRGVAVEQANRSLFASVPTGEGLEPPLPPGDLPAAEQDVDVLWMASTQDVWVGFPDGRWCFDRRSGARILVEAHFLIETASYMGVVDQVVDPKRPIDVTILVAEARDRARARAGSEPAEPGLQAVVLAPSLAGIVVHELVGHRLDGLDGDGSAQNGVDPATRLGPPELAVVDDPRRGRMGWRLDDRGNEASAVLLVEGGRAVGCLADGHRRRVSFREPPLPRMGCTYIRPGPHPADAILTSTPKGIYVRRMNAAGVDPDRRRAVFRVTDADAIEDGGAGRPLDPFLLEVETQRDGIPFDFIGDDLAFDRCIGSCLRGGQPLPTSVGAPTCRLGLARVLA